MSAGAKNVVFVHPDLGIGGAERLVIDAAVGLKSVGYNVTILTSHCDPQHCFEEARDGTLDVRVRGDSFFPPTIAGRFKILMSILRQIALVIAVSCFSSELQQLNPDVIVVDQLSVCVPLFRILRPSAKILFYGHFPDRLLAQEGTGLTKTLKKNYRVPFDFIEGWSTGCADEVVVNSKFTRSIFRQTFPTIRARDLKVIYPCVDTDVRYSDSTASTFLPGKKLLLSINRLEGKKNLDLALTAYAGLSSEERSKARLIIAGGFDPRLDENILTHRNLQALADSLKLKHATFRSKEHSLSDLDSYDVDVCFWLSVPENIKKSLLHAASILIYTPTNEHFGIVPLEAMLACVPVLATNTGGPLETIYDGRTGWLRSRDKVAQWTDVMRKPIIPSSVDGLKAMGERGRERVLAEFSHTKMTESFNQEIQKLWQSRGPRPEIFSRGSVVVALAVAFVLLAAVFTLIVL